MRATSLKLSSVKIGGARFFQVVFPVLPKGRGRKTFKRKPEAQAFFDLKSAEIKNHGIASAGLTTQQRADVLWCEQQLQPYGLNLRQAVESLLPQLKAREHGLSVGDAVKRLIESKRAAGLSKRHLYCIENRLERFASAYPGRTLASFTLRDVEAWLNALPMGAQSVNHYKATLHSLFAYGVKIGACVANPVAGIDSRKVVRPAPSILTPAQLSALLTSCGDDTEMLAFLAVAAFAGLRRAEIERLKWEDVSLSRGFLTVSAENSKTSKRRLVPIGDALRAWLAPIAQPAGAVGPRINFRRRFKAVRERAGLLSEWEGNELRHSYASYRLAVMQDAPKTALEMGNSPSVLLAHYRELATAEDGASWFAVMPNTEGKLVPFERVA